MQGSKKQSRPLQLEDVELQPHIYKLRIEMMTHVLLVLRPSSLICRGARIQASVEPCGDDGKDFSAAFHELQDVLENSHSCHTIKTNQAVCDVTEKTVLENVMRPPMRNILDHVEFPYPGFEVHFEHS